MLCNTYLIIFIIIINVIKNDVFIARQNIRYLNDFDCLKALGLT